MIRINTSHIGPEGLTLSGKESPEILELTDARTGLATGPIAYTLHCSMAGHDLVALGSAKVAIKAECGRCLKEVDTAIEAKSICHHYENVSEKEMDITNDIREDILVALPQTFLCSPACKGLCPSCGADLNEGKCKCRRKPDEGPSAWGALDKLDI